MSVEVLRMPCAPWLLRGEHSPVTAPVPFPPTFGGASGARCAGQAPEANTHLDWGTRCTRADAAVAKGSEEGSSPGIWAVGVTLVPTVTQ